MTAQQLKISLLLIGVMAVCTFFISVGNESDIVTANDEFRGVLKDYELRLIEIETKLNIYELKFGMVTGADTTTARGIEQEDGKSKSD